MNVHHSFELALLALAALLTALLLSQYLTVILGAVLLAYLLRTPHRWLSPWIGARPAALGLLALTLVVVVVPFVLLVGVAIAGISSLAETVLGEEREMGQATLEDLLGEVFGADFDLEASITETLRSGDVLEFVPTALEVIGGLSEAFVALTILLVLSYGLLVSGDRLVAWLASRAPLAAEERSELLARAEDLMYAVVIGNVAVGVVDGLLVGVGLYATGFSNVLFWTLMAVFLALIPVVGSMIVWVPAGGYLIATGDVVPGVLLLGYGAVVVGSVDNLLRPYVGANRAELDPALFIVGIFSGLSVLGVMGLFFGPIVLAMAKHVVDVVGTNYADAAPG